jgi:hypothetical protein
MRERVRVRKVETRPWCLVDRVVPLVLRIGPHSKKDRTCTMFAVGAIIR